MLSVIVPSYKNPKYLDACLNSALKTQKNKNEIIVVIDGYPELSENVISKYENDISFLTFEENRGMQQAINYGVYNSTNENILVVSEDNIFPMNWDVILEEHINQYNTNIKMDIDNGFVITPNQMEPTGPSIYNFKFHDLGDKIEDFNFDKFIEIEPTYRSNHLSPDGSTFPFCMRKKDFLKLGGFDTEYNSPFVVDWDFFLKAELANMYIARLHNLNFYHFVSKSTKNRNGYIENPNEKQNFFDGERKASEYFKYKWGFYPNRNEFNRCSHLIIF